MWEQGTDEAGLPCRFVSQREDCQSLPQIPTQRRRWSPQIGISCAEGAPPSLTCPPSRSFHPVFLVESISSKTVLAALWFVEAGAAVQGPQKEGAVSQVRGRGGRGQAAGRGMLGRSGKYTS